MNGNPQWAGDRGDALIHGLLDRTLDDSGHAELSAALRDDPEFARRLARMTVLHDAISREVIDSAAGRRQASAFRLASSLRRWAVAASVVLAAGALAFVVLARGSSADAAAREVARLGQMRPATCRTYQVRAIDEPARPRARKGRRDAGTGIRNRPVLSGATLHVGLPGQFVLEGEDESGDRAAVGSDGIVSWSAPARGPVRVSDDAARFRGVLPGEQHGIPFVDPADGMAELLRSFTVRSAPAERIGDRSVDVIVARRRTDVARGPREVRIWFDPETATIVRMSLERLPQANGGPRSVVLELVSESPIDPRFFGHAPHHALDRPVLPELSP